VIDVYHGTVVIAENLPEYQAREPQMGDHWRPDPKAVSEVQESSCLIPPIAHLRLNPVKASVLVVDDSPEMQRYLRVLLEADSYQVETASNGQEALQRLGRGCVPQVVLLDLQMPGMDGLETLRRMQEFGPRPKVIICSGVDDPIKILEVAALGAHAFLVKPIQHLYLSAAIERCLNQGAAKRPARHSRAQVFVLPSPM
jgi:CheY-like chemotaxis protein